MGITEFSNKKYTWYMAVLTLLVFSFLLRCYKINEPSVWMDEDRQATYVIQSLKTGYFSGQAAIFSAKQQQPPLGYLLEGIGVTNFGVTPFGIRVHAAFWGALTVGVFLLILTILFPTQYKWYLFCLTLFFSFHPLLLRYSQEARPVAVGIFFGAIYLYMLLRFVFAKQYINVSDGIIEYLLLIVTQTLFMLSLGFQPIAISFCFGLILLLFFLFNKPLRKKCFLAATASILSLILFCPIQIFIYSKAEHYTNSQAQSHTGILYFFKQIFTNDLSIIPFERYKFFWKILTGLPFWPTFVFFIILFLIILFTKKIKNKDMLIFLGINCIVFPIIFYFIFESFINYRITQRYILVAVNLYLVTLCSMSFSVLVAFFGKQFWDEKRGSGFQGYFKSFRIIFILLFLVLLIPGYHFTDRFNSVLGAPKRDWKQLYALFSNSKISSKGDVAFAMNLRAEGKWGPGFYSKRFYYVENQLVKTFTTGNRNVGVIYDLLGKGGLNKAEHIYLCFITGSDYIRDNKDVWKYKENIEIISLKYMTIIKIKKNGKTSRQALLEFFNPWVNKLPPQPITEHIYKLTNRINQYNPS